MYNEEDQNFLFDKGVLMNKAMTHIFVFLPSCSINMYVPLASVKQNSKDGQICRQMTTSMHSDILESYLLDTYQNQPRAFVDFIEKKGMKIWKVEIVLSICDLFLLTCD